MPGFGEGCYARLSSGAFEAVEYFDALRASDIPLHNSAIRKGELLAYGVSSFVLLGGVMVECEESGLYHIHTAPSEALRSKMKYRAASASA